MDYDEIYHIDVKSVFLNDYLKEEVYIKQPPRYVLRVKKNKVLIETVIGIEISSKTLKYMNPWAFSKELFYEKSKMCYTRGMHILLLSPLM